MAAARRTGLSTAQLSEHLDVSTRQLDYLVRRYQYGISTEQVLPDLADLGSGARRIWPLSVVGRLEVANALAAVIVPFYVGGRAQAKNGWTPIADAVLRAMEQPPPSGWVLLDGGHAVNYADSVQQLDLIALDLTAAEGDGGILAYYQLSDMALGQVEIPPPAWEAWYQTIAAGEP